MSLLHVYNAGAAAALEKLAVSGALYQRALYNAAKARRGGLGATKFFPETISSPERAVSLGAGTGTSRASFNPEASFVARTPGALMPSEEQLAMRKFTGMLQTGSLKNPLSPQQELRNRALFELSGHQHQAAPGMEDALRATPTPGSTGRAHATRRSFGVPEVGSPRHPDTVVGVPAELQQAATGVGKRPARPSGAGAAFTGMGRGLPPIPPGAGKSRSFEAFEPTQSWGGGATMPEHLHSIPGMPAWAPR